MKIEDIERQGSHGEIKDDRYGNAPERHAWHRRVEEEEAKRARSHDAGPENIYRWAEEYSSLAMQGVDASTNAFQEAMEKGDEKDFGDPSDLVANATDITGG